jgi:hypothetical protein
MGNNNFLILKGVIVVLIEAERLKHSHSYGFIVLTKNSAASAVSKAEVIILPSLKPAQKKTATPPKRDGRLSGWLDDP